MSEKFIEIIIMFFKNLHISHPIFVDVVAFVGIASIAIFVIINNVLMLVDKMSVFNYKKVQQELQIEMLQQQILNLKLQNKKLKKELNDKARIIIKE